MGQRHQLFVIAKVFRRYRTLAALHNQWLYGERPLERCLRLLAILQTKSNRIPITQELRAAREKPEEFWTGDAIVQAFPFIATCLTVGSSFEPDVGYSARVHPMAFNTTLDQVDNNDGITVIDISNLDRFRYCFAFPDKRRPLSASAYLSLYFKLRRPPGSDTENIEGYKSEGSNLSVYSERQGLDEDTLFAYEELAEQLEAYELIDASTLESTWPTSAVEDAVEDAVEYEETPPEEPFDEVQSTSLRNLTVDQFVKHTLENTEVDANSIAEAQQLPNFAPKLRSKLVSLAQENELPSSSTTAHLLGSAFAGEVTVDLSVFQHLTAEHVVDAASGIIKSGSTKSLDLSRMRQLSEVDVKSILDADSTGQLETLYLLEMPQISVQFVASILNQATSRFKNIYHTELFRSPIADCDSDYQKLKSVIQAPPFVVTTPNSPIKQILWARILSLNDQPHLRKSDGVTIDWQRSEPAYDFIHFENKMHSAVFPLHDIYLPPTKLVTGLVNFFTCAAVSTKPEYMGYAPAGFTMAKSFAMARSSLDEPATRMGPLPGTLYNASSLAASVAGMMWPIPFPEMKVGEWSVVIVNEHYLIARSEVERVQEKFRLAVITPGEEGGFRVESMESFLAEAMGKREAVDMEMKALAEYWRSQVGFVGMCGKEEVDELVPAFKRNVEAVRESKGFVFTERCWEHL